MPMGVETATPTTKPRHQAERKCGPNPGFMALIATDMAADMNMAIRVAKRIV